MPMGLACAPSNSWRRARAGSISARFGAEVIGFAAQSDVDDRGGTVTYKDGAGGEAHLRPDGGAQMGDCHGRVRIDGRDYRSYAVLQGVDRILPVDVYVAGCSAAGPEALLDALIRLQNKVAKEPVMRRRRKVAA